MIVLGKSIVDHVFIGEMELVLYCNHWHLPYCINLMIYKKKYI